MPEFRWILLGLGLLLLGGIWWWGNRRPTQARGNAELRESEPSSNFSTTVIADHPLTMTLDTGGPKPAAFPANPIVREPSVSPYEPLRISAQEVAAPAGEFDLPIMVEPAVDSQVLQIDDVQMLVETTTVDPGAATILLPTAEPAAEPAPTPAALNSSSGRYRRLADPARSAGSRDPGPAAGATAARTDTSGRFARVKPADARPEQPPPAVELQKIIAVRVCAVADGVWDGTDLATAFAGSDLVHGRYGVFHRLHADGRSVFCVASLVEPGSFDPAHMPEQRFPGISIFAVLPGPMEPLQTFEELMAAARQLAQDLSGMMQDEKGGPLSPQRAGSLREDVIRFQQLLHADATH